MHLRLNRADVSMALRREDGFGIVGALVVAMVVFLLGAAIAATSIHAHDSTAYDQARTETLHVADAGVGFAISVMAAGDAAYAGTTSLVTSGTGQFCTVVIDGAPAIDQGSDGIQPDVGDPTRYITSWAVGDRGVERKVEQQVNLVPLEGFRFALFSSPEDMNVSNHSTVQGDLYSRDDLFIDNHSVITGNVWAVGDITIQNNVTVTGNVWAGGSVTMNFPQIVVQGDVVAARSSIVNRGMIQGEARAGSTITNTGTILGGQTANLGTSEPLPPALDKPTITWASLRGGWNTAWTGNPATDPAIGGAHQVFYWGDVAPGAGAGTSTAGADFNAWVTANKNNLHGLHFINASAAQQSSESPPTATIGSSNMRMTSDFVVFSEIPITWSRDLADGRSGGGLPELNVHITSMYVDPNPATGPTASINMTNQFTVPSSINVLVFTPGYINVSQQKTFDGTIYGTTIGTNNQMTVTYDPPEAWGFTWPPAASLGFDVEPTSWREVVADALPASCVP